jgi:hypothetical protein
MKRQWMYVHLMDHAMSTTIRDVLSSWLLDPLIYAGAFLSADFSTQPAGASPRTELERPSNLLRVIIS